MRPPPPGRAGGVGGRSAGLDEALAGVRERTAALGDIDPVTRSGKAITAKYLAAAGHTLGNADFAYVGEWHRENSAILEFETVIDGIAINGIDMISCDDDGLITHFKVMVRPLKAMNMLHQKMGEMLQRMSQ